MKVRLVFEGAGVAILFLILYFWSLIAPYHLLLYHNVHSVSGVAGGVSIDLIAAWVLCTSVLALLDHYDPQQSSFVWAVLLGVLIRKAIFVAISIYSMGNTHYALEGPSQTVRKAALVFAVAAAVLLWRLSRHRFQQSVSVLRAAVALVGLSICWMLPQLLFFALHTPAETVNAFVGPGLPEYAPPQGRIVWILLDELSYDQVFDHRQSDVELPNLDRLRKESVSFANVQPAGFYTDQIIPALFLGRPIDGVRSSLQKDLFVHEAGKAGWEPFDPNATLFGDAKRFGWSTGIAGWFNPYCHILQNVLDSCYWESLIFSQLSGDLSVNRTAIANALTLPSAMMLSPLRGKSLGPVFESALRVQEYKNLMQAASSLAQNDDVRFAFIHLPVPHPGGFYDRRTRTFSANGTYLDNLVLADQTLGALMDILSKTSAASSTTLIVSSDHSWRVPMWRNAPEWTKEEERASGGRFDPRPVLLVRFPGENAGETRKEPFPELETHGMIEGMLEDQLRSQTALDDWLIRNAHSFQAEKSGPKLLSP
jgi:hypothetical protein